MIIDENGEARHSRYTTTKSIIGIVCCHFQVILGKQVVTHLYPARAIHTKWIFNHKNLPVTDEDKAFIKPQVQKGRWKFGTNGSAIVAVVQSRSLKATGPQKTKPEVKPKLVGSV